MYIYARQSVSDLMNIFATPFSFGEEGRVEGMTKLRLQILVPFFLLLSVIILSIPACIVFYNLLIRDSIFWFLFSMKKKHAVSSV